MSEPTSFVSTTTAASPPPPAPDEERYEDFLTALRTPPSAAPLARGDRLFTTNVPEGVLWQLFLDSLPVERRQHYTCRACQRFVERFGGLVTIDASGQASPAFWDFSDAVPPFFRSGVQAMSRAVARASVTGVFLSAEKVWGMPENSSKKPPFEWHHMAVTPPASLVHKSVLLTAEQVIAEKLQERDMLVRGIDEFPIGLVREAHTLLTTGNLYRSEKCIGVARWLLDLHEAREGTRNERVREQLVWRAVATAPAGFCHVRSGMIGTLLEDIAAKLPFADIKAKFDAKMHPLAYQRPQAPPAAGNIAQAEVIVGKLRSAGALERRFARLEDITTAVWREVPKPPSAPAGGGVFGHIKPKDAAEVPKRTTQPAVTITWVKFLATVLPDAERIEMLMPHDRVSFAALITTANLEAPPILQWDNDEKRNPLSWYYWNGGSTAGEWNLKAGSWVRVPLITYQPSMWADPEAFAHQGRSVFFILEGARDLRKINGGGGGGGFFVESLKAEYHSIRSTLEAYARTGVVAGGNEATACGYGFQSGSKDSWKQTVRVTSKGGAQVLYTFDRWD